MKELSTSTTVAEEVSAITNYIRLKWTPIAELESLVAEVASAACHAAKGWFDQHDIWQFAVNESDAREVKLFRENVNFGESYYEAGCHFLNQMETNASLVRTALVPKDWDFSRETDKVTKAMQAKYSDLKGAKPNGWEALRQGYSDFDGQEEYNAKADRELFQGSSTETAAAGDFVIRTALPYVMYDDVGQGRKPPKTLVSSIFAHFLTVQEHLNTQAMLKEFADVVSKLPNEHVYAVDVTFTHPILKVLHAECDAPYTKAQHDEFLEARRVFEALTPEEKAKKIAENKERMNLSLANLTAEDIKYQSKRDKRIARVQQNWAKELA